jgi:hypothetical protein
MKEESKSEWISKPEIEAFMEKLKEKEYIYNSKIQFLHDHKFNKEMEFWETKRNVMREIRHELQAVVQGHRKGIDATFLFH